MQTNNNPPIPLKISTSPPLSSMSALSDSLALTVHAYATCVLPPQSRFNPPVLTKAKRPTGRPQLHYKDGEPENLGH